jgi:probable rRNA maturation factor
VTGFPATAMPVDVQIASHSPAPGDQLIQRWAEGALACAHGGGDDAELCIRVVNEEESRRLNRDYRDQDAPTNVLSFPAGIDLPDLLILGDVVVCASVVQREADAQHKQYEDHFAHMVVHGVLHLLGYDHQADADAAAMERLEIRILDGFGISDPYGEG